MSEVIKHEGKYYIEVDRFAKVGDKIRIVNGESPSHYHNSDIFTVKEVLHDGDVTVEEDVLSGDADCIWSHEFKVLEEIGIPDIEVEDIEGNNMDLLLNKVADKLADRIYNDFLLRSRYLH